MINNKEQLYLQIKKYIENMIEMDELKPDDRVPSENELMEKFSVSRITAKRALNILSQEGKVYRMQGRGTFVASGAKKYIEVSEYNFEENVQTIALILPQLNSSFILEILRGVLCQAESCGYNVIVHKTDELIEKEEKKIKKMSLAGVNGIIIYPVEGELYNTEILKLTLKRFPLVVIDRYLKGINTNVVHTDNFTGAYEATRHLIELGHKKIGFISIYSQSSSVEDRIRGYEKALADNGLPVDYRLRLDEIITQDIKTEIEQITKYLKRNNDMTALLTINNEIGRKLFVGMKAEGLSIPEDISVVFFDDYQYADMFKVPPTCVIQQGEKMGKEAVKLINRIIEEPDREYEKIILPPELKRRSSTQLLKNTI